MVSENVFYQTSGEMIQYIQKECLSNEQTIQNSIINFMAWRRSRWKLFVTTIITMEVAKGCKTSIKSYYNDIRKLRRKTYLRRN
jgi:phosphoenolpyruvate carboxylase